MQGNGSSGGRGGGTCRWGHEHCASCELRCAMQPSLIDRMALMDGLSHLVPGTLARFGCHTLFLTLSGDQKSFDFRPRSSSDSYDRNMAFTELLTYTMEWHDANLPLGDFAVRMAKNAPSIVIGEWFAAVRFRRTGRRS